MDKPITPKTAWPLHVQEIKQRTITLLEDCARQAGPFGFLLNTDRVTEIMRSGAAESFRAIVKYCESQPDFLPEQFDEIADQTVTETLCLAPILFFRSSRYKESVPAIREALKAELQAVLRQRKERAGAFSKTGQGGGLGPSEDKSSEGRAGPAVNAGKSEGKGRKRGPKPDHESAVRVAEIVTRLAPDGDWRSKLDDVGYALDHGVCNAPEPEICDVSDHEKIPVPGRWRRNQNTWLSPPDRATMVKAIEYRLENAGKNPIKKTLS